MKTKITKTKVDAQIPTVKDHFIWDTEIIGFGLKTTPVGDKIFVFQYRLPGRSNPLRFTIGRYKGAINRPGEWTVAEARREAEILRGNVSRGRDPRQRKEDEKAARLAELSLSEVCDLYLEAAPQIILKGKGRPKKSSTLAIDRSNIERHIKPRLGRKRIQSIRRADVEKFQRDIAAGKTAIDSRTGHRGRARVTGGRGTAARAATVLGTVFSFAQKEGFVSESPVQGVELFRSPGRERFLTIAELEKLGGALSKAENDGVNPTAISAIRLLIFTGCRKTEILSLRWKDIDFQRRCLFLPDSKTGRKTVPLAAPALEILSTIPCLADSPFVFPAARGNGHYVGLPKVWSLIRAQAGLEDVTLHTLRHSFASFAVASGDSLYLVGKVLGHRQSRTTEKYAHLELDPVRNVADRTAETIARAMCEPDSVDTFPMRNFRAKQ